jgi:AraC-like DNA-binding protein
VLKKHIKFFWEIEADFMQLDHTIIPVRNIDLKFNLSETPHYQKIGTQSHLLEKVYFSGLQDRFRNARITLKGKVHVLGICFFPDGFYPFLKIPVNECKNQLLGAGELALFATKTLHEKLMEAPDIASRLTILEHELISVLDTRIQTPEGFRRLFHYLNQSELSMQIAEFCQRSNIGMRKLERMFNKYVGISVKSYRMLDRFQHSINQLFWSDYSKLSDVAYGNDYFDQMHFIRDFKRFAGSTPSGFIRQNNSMLHIR